MESCLGCRAGSTPLPLGGVENHWPILFPAPLSLQRKWKKHLLIVEMDHSSPESFAIIPHPCILFQSSQILKGALVDGIVPSRLHCLAPRDSLSNAWLHGAWLHPPSTSSHDTWGVEGEESIQSQERCKDLAEIPGGGSLGEQAVFFGARKRNTAEASF